MFASRKSRCVRRLGVAAAALAATVVMAGCSSGPSHDDIPEQPAAAVIAHAQQLTGGEDAGVTLVVGARANTPRPHLSALTTALLQQAIGAGEPVNLVKVAAVPQQVTLDLDTPTATDTDDGRAAIVTRGVKTIVAETLTPVDADGADLLESITLAAGTGRATGTTHPVIVVADSGLSDHGRLVLTDPGMLGADPAETLAGLKATGGLPDLTGMKIVLSGLGYTAAPQAPLDAATRDRVTAIWTAVLRGAGATITVDPAPNTRTALDTDHTVTTTTPPAPPKLPTPCTPSTLVFNQQSAVSFIEDRDTLINPAAARTALAPVAAWLAAEPGRTARIEGTTANDGDLTYQKQLGARRARVVADILTTQSAPAEHITTTGVGSAFPEYVRPDRDTTGHLLPGPATLNRSVRIHTTDNC